MHGVSNIRLRAHKKWVVLAELGAVQYPFRFLFQPQIRIRVVKMMMSAINNSRPKKMSVGKIMGVYLEQATTATEVVWTEHAPEAISVAVDYRNHQNGMILMQLANRAPQNLRGHRRRSDEL